MAVNPDDLLIFKVRGQQKRPAIEDKKKQEAKPEPKPKVLEVQRPVEAPKPVIERIVPQQRPKAAKQEKKPFSLFAKRPNIPEEPKMAAQPKKIAKIPVPQPERVEIPAYRPKPAYTAPAAVQQERAPPETQTMRDIYASVQREAQEQLVAAMKTSTGEFAAKELLATKGQAQTRTEADSIAAAKNMFCTWHPWRPAYAVCNWCHRAFCFEDTTEYNGALYCLEDIDKVSAGMVAKTGSEYNNISILASTLMFVTFLAFLYFDNAQLGYIVGFANSVGFLNFVSAITESYGFALIEAVTTFFALVAAILILAQSRKGYFIGLGSGLVNVALFSYQYLSTSTLYLLVISILAFASLITLAYSRSIFEEKEIPYLETKQYGVEWPNAGRF